MSGKVDIEWEVIAFFAFLSVAAICIMLAAIFA